MNYNLIENGNSCTLNLSGEIDLHFSPQLRELILDIFKKYQAIEIDLTDVSYLDSSGVACFIEAYQLSKKNKTDFFLTNISQPAMQVIKLARLDTVFPVK